MRIKVRTMIDDYYGGDRNVAAKAADVTVQFLNNWVSNDREVARLDNGDWVLLSKTTKIFKKAQL